MIDYYIDTFDIQKEDSRTILEGYIIDKLPELYKLSEEDKIHIIIKNDSITHIEDSAFDIHQNRYMCIHSHEMIIALMYQVCEITITDCPNLKEIGDHAFFGLGSEYQGTFTLNISKCPNLEYISPYAF